MRPNAPLKEEIVEFFNLQIRVHHPEGAKTQDAGWVMLLFLKKNSGGEAFAVNIWYVTHDFCLLLQLRRCRHVRSPEDLVMAHILCYELAHNSSFLR